MTEKLSDFEIRLRSARFPDEILDPFKQIVARLPEDWINTRGFEFAAGTALRLKANSPTYAPVGKLFKAANLDHQIPWHWPLLLVLIAWVASERRGPGRTKTWTPAKIKELKRDIAALTAKRNHSLVAKTLRKKFPDKYGKFKPDYLRKVVHRAMAEQAVESL